MAWNGSGTYNKGNLATGGWVGDAAASIPIQASRHDTQDNDFATGINNCLAKDGQNAMTADLNVGGQRIRNVALGTAALPAIYPSTDSNTGIYSPGADTLGFATGGVDRLQISTTAITANNLQIKGLAAPTVGTDAVTKTYADNLTGAGLVGDKGDITVSAAGATWTIDPSVVTYSKIQNVSATDRLLGRSTAGAGVVEEIVCTAAGRALIDDVDAAAQRATLGLTGLATQADGDKGDITVSASGGTWTIDNSAVTYAKIQNVTATDRLLGRSTAGAGVVEEVVCTAAGRALIDDADATAQRATLGLSAMATQAGTALTSLNAQTGATQTFATGTTGTDVNVSSAANVHTINVPDASATARGVVTTGTQTIAGNKTFTGTTVVTGAGSDTAFRVTQTGTGNALLIEDSANPDSTPLVVTGDGSVGIGTALPAALLHLKGGNAYIDGSAGGGSLTVDGDIDSIYSFVRSQVRIQSPLFVTGTFDTEPVPSTTGRLRAVDANGNVANVSGGNIDIAGGKGTGNAQGGYVTISTSAPGASGTTVQSLAERVRINPSGLMGIGTNAPLGTIDAIRASGAANSWYRFAGDCRTSPPWTSTNAQGLMIGNNRTVGTANVSLAWGTGSVGTAALTFDTWDGTTYTERARIDASGNLGIGTNAANAKIDISNGIGNDLNLTKFDSAVSGATINLRKSKTASINTNTIVASGDSLGEIYFAGANGTTYTSAAAIIGAVDGTPGASNDMPGRLQFFTTLDNTGSLAERARITSSGRVGINQTVPGSQLHVRTTETTVAAQSLQSDVAGDVANPVQSLLKTDNNSTTSQIFVRFAINGGITGSGQINANGASAAAFGTFSDARLKENVENLPDTLPSVMQLRPVEFDYRDGSGHQIGFIAQEVREIWPDVVAPDQDGFLMISGLGKTEARLIRAIQSLAAKVESLEARIAALEAK